MDVERRSRIERIFREALAREHQDRESFLDRECAGDLSWLREIQALPASCEGKSNLPEHSPAERNTNSASLSPQWYQVAGACGIVPPLAG